MHVDIKTIINHTAQHRAERIIPPGAKSAAVLIPLTVLENEEPRILFEKRSPEVRQGGEICFPGGRIEAGETPEQTAVRETSEELLISPGKIELIAPMFVMAGPGGAEIHSFLGRIREYTGTFNRDEAENVFTIPLQWFFENPPEIHRGRMRLEVGEDYPWHLIPGGRAYPMRTIPRELFFYETPHGVIWGMTAELLYHFMQLLPFES